MHCYTTRADVDAFIARLGATLDFFGDVSGGEEAAAASAGAAELEHAPRAASADGDLAWDANAAWLEQCSTSGVVSWYDVGLRLTAPETASTPRGD